MKSGRRLLRRGHPATQGEDVDGHLIRELLIYKRHIFILTVCMKAKRTSRASLDHLECWSQVFVLGLNKATPTHSYIPKLKRKKKEEGLFFLLWSSQNLRVFSPKRIKACMYVSAAFVFLPCAPLSAFLGPPAKSPQIPNATPKAWALLLSSFYHRTLLALATLLYLWQEFLSKAPHCISNTSDSPLHYPRLTHRRTRNAAVSCPNTVWNPPKIK